MYLFCVSVAELYINDTNCCNCGTGFLLGIRRSLVSLVHEQLEALGSLLRVLQLGELSGDPHEFALHRFSSD